MPRMVHPECVELTQYAKIMMAATIVHAHKDIQEMLTSNASM